MRQWKTISSNNYIIDNRKREEILDQIKELAKSYVPEWRLDIDNPDIGSVIALLFSEQLQENIQTFNTLPYKDYIELVNMLDISLNPAYPAHSLMVMDVVNNTVPGIKIKKGTKFIGSSEEADDIVFESSHHVYVTQSKLKNIFMTSAKSRKVMPVFGEFNPVEYIENANEYSEVVEDIETIDTYEEKKNVITPFVLFDFDRPEYGKNGVLIYHKYMFDVENNEICVKINDAEELIEKIAEGKWIFYYYTDNGFEKVSNLKIEDGDKIIFEKEKTCKKVTISGNEYSVILLEPMDEVDKNVEVSEITLASSGKMSGIQHIWNGNNELASDMFQPFGDTIAMYSELYVGHEYFAKPDSRIKLQFQLEFDTHIVSFPVEEDDTNLQIIKRKPRRILQNTPAEIYAQEITMEYYNGIGWRKLQTFSPVTQIFKEGKNGHCEIEFDCPNDWRETEIGGANQRCIRIQVVKADNCYYQPAIHHYPIIKYMRVSYSYEDNYKRPQRLECVHGCVRSDVTHYMNQNQGIPLFCRSKYEKNALYMAFDKKMENGPISILFQIEETECYTDGNMVFMYSTREGFSRLKLTDHTHGLSHTGTIMFMPPSDMAKKRIEGIDAYWIVAVDEFNYFDMYKFAKPTICNVAINAIDVDNIETHEEDEYYMDTFEANMKFPLNATNILGVEVWVNEISLYGDNDMKKMLLEKPDKTRCEYNFLGEIVEFYVKWDEVGSFDNSVSTDRHYVIDRMNNIIHFGDGVHVQIPKNTNGVAFKTIITSCDGKKANLNCKEINGTYGNIMFAENIYNPVRAYGGMDMESIDDALRRGTTIINGRHRLVSAMDYELVALNFSKRISQAKVITGYKKDGSFDAAAVTLVLLMDDYTDGSYSFINTKKRLKEYMLSACELTVDIEKLEIVEPIYAEISIEAWVSLLDMDELFEVQQSLIESLENYLNPIKNECWIIGRAISRRQIELKMSMEKKNSIINNIQISVAYRDRYGRHETDLDSIVDNPYVLVTSGTHKIHFE